MCGGWAVEVGAGEASVWHSWRPGQAQEQGLATLLPYYYSHYSQPRPRRWPTGHTPPSPQSSWRGHTRHQMTASPGPGPGLCQVHSLGPGCPGPFRSEEWGLVRLHCSQPQPGAGPGPGADYRVQVRDRPGPEHNTATDTCHYTGPGEHSDSGDQPTKDEPFCWIQ